MLDRTLIKSGPAILTWNGATMYFQNGLTIEEIVETFDVSTDALIAPDKRVQDIYVTIKGAPSGQWTGLGVWFPWVAALPGARAFGASDKAAVVHFMDGDKFTYHNAALVAMPDLELSSLKVSMSGNVELECRRKLNTAADDAAALFTRDTASFTDTSFNWTQIVTPVFNASWTTDDESTWYSFATREGFKISAKPTWQAIVCDGQGVVEKELASLSVSASFSPLGVAQADIDAKLAAQGSSAAFIGARRAAVAESLTISGANVYVQIRSAFLQKVAMQSGVTGRGRHGDFQAMATLGLDGGPIAQISIVDD